MFQSHVKQLTGLLKTLLLGCFKVQMSKSALLRALIWAFPGWFTDNEEGCVFDYEFTVQLLPEMNVLDGTEDTVSKRILLNGVKMVSVVTCNPLVSLS